MAAHLVQDTHITRKPDLPQHLQQLSDQTTRQRHQYPPLTKIANLDNLSLFIHYVGDPYARIFTEAYFPFLKPDQDLITHVMIKEINNYSSFN